MKFIQNFKRFSKNAAMRLVLFLLFIVLLLPMAAHAREIHLQQTNGPSAGAIKFGMGFSPKNPNIIYVDRYKSSDAGRTWQEFDVPTTAAINNITVDPNSPDIVFLAATNVVFKSINGAKTWQKLGSLGPPPDTPGWDSRSVSAMAVHPSQSGIIFAGTTNGHLYRSKDGGQQWSDISSALDVASPISRIKFNPQNAKEIYISTGSWYLSSTSERPKIGNGLFKSSDGGETFSNLKNEFSSYLVHDVEVLGNTVYVVTRYAPDTDDDWKGVYRSRDKGQTWEKLLDSRSSPFPLGTLGLTHIAVNPSNEKHIIITVGNDTGNVAFALSYDGGDTWKPVITDKVSVQYSHELEMLADGRVYAQEYYVPFLKSGDGGVTWQWSADGIRRSSITALQIHPNNRNVVFAGTVDGSLHKTYDGGKKWYRTYPDLLGSYVSTIEFDPRDMRRFYFGVSQGSDGTTGLFSEPPTRDSGFYVTNDEGKTWSKATGLKHPKSPHQFHVYDILVHPDNPNLILVGTGADGVYRSEDGGKTWQEANRGIPQEGFYWNYLFDSPGEDKLERECKRGLSKDLGCFFYATRTSMHLYVNPHEKNEIWYTTLNGIFVSKDLGKSWRWLSDDLKHTHVHFMAFDPSDQNIIYVGTHQGGIGQDGKVISSSKGLLISRDGGKTWSQIIHDKRSENDEQYGPGEGHNIRAIAVNPKNPNFVAVGTQSGFFISENKGRTWKELKLQQGEVSQIEEIRIDSTAKLMYLGTREGGVWRAILDNSYQGQALIEITGVSAPKSVKSGETFNIVISIDNVGGKSGSLPVRLKIEEYKESKTVQVAAVDQSSVSFPLNLRKAGNYEIIVNDSKYGEVNVVAGEVPERKATALPKIETSETLQKSIQISNSEVTHPPKRSFVWLLRDTITSFFRKLLSR